jgi:hypothetical protein
LADFLYSAQFVIPPVKSPSGPYPFGGLLILAREVRRVDLPSGGSIAVWGVLDVQVVPPLQPGEAFAPDPGPCRLVGAPAGGGSASGGNEADAGLAALVMVKGHENDAVWKDVRKAWRFNHRTSRIEEMPASQVFCQNETLGL